MNFQSIKNSARATAAMLLLATAALATSQTPKPAAATKKCLFWKAVNGTNVVYLLGSIHLASKAVYPLPKVIDDAFARSKALVVEVDVTKIDPAASMEYLSKGTYTDGDNLWNHLQPKTVGRVKKYLADQNTPDTMFASFKPWLAGVTIPLISMMKAGAATDLGIDQHFLKLATGKKKIDQVETADFQFKLLSSVPDSLGDVYMNYCLGETEKDKSESLQLEKLWLDGDADKLQVMMNQHPKELDGLMRQLLEDRNPKMADVAEKYLKGGGPCFFVVGAAHLIGPEGVVALLQKRGYTVMRLQGN
jgi:uncharacterized protein YbaP (TraB family)